MKAIALSAVLGVAASVGSVATVAVEAALDGRGAGPGAGASAGAEAPAEWIEVAKHEFDDARVRRPEGQGAMGASVIGFRIEPYQGSMIVEVLGRGAVAVFLGWNVADKHARRAADDLRVVFHELDGTEHETKLSAGGSWAVLFHSPDDVPIAKLSHFTLMRRDKASWAKRNKRRKR